jgi:KEOPS complex subunit Cgi121
VQKIIGAKGKIQDINSFLKKIITLSNRYDMVIQVVNADFVYGKDHLFSAVEHTIRSFKNQMNSLNSLSLEMLLYASGERQIQKAIEKIGIKNGNQKIAFIFIRERNGKISDDEVEHVLSSLNLKRNDKVLEGDVDTLKRFGITEDELSTIPESKYGDLLLEKVALVDIIK